MFNIYLASYIILAIFVIAGGSYKLMGDGQTMGGIIFLLGTLFIFTLYGLKWFSTGAILSQTPVSWPPIINTCPDYLVYYGRSMPDGTTQDTCIDMIGVSKNGSLKLFPKDGQAPSSDDYYFSLTTKSSDPTSKNNELCQKAINMGLTWEGITNGESCISSSGTPTSGGNSGGACPSV